MAGIFDKLGKAATDAANMAGNKAEELIEVGKLKSKISSTKQEIGMTMKEIGEYCYRAYENGDMTDDKITELCKKIEDCNKQIESLETQIKIAKNQC